MSTEGNKNTDSSHYAVTDPIICLAPDFGIKGHCTNTNLPVKYHAQNVPVDAPFWPSTTYYRKLFSIVTLLRYYNTNRFIITVITMLFPLICPTM